jgi:hypothetical protein
VDAGCMGEELEQGASGAAICFLAFAEESVGLNSRSGEGPQADFLTFYHCFLLDYPKLPEFVKFIYH